MPNLQVIEGGLKVSFDVLLAVVGVPELALNEQLFSFDSAGVQHLLKSHTDLSLHGVRNSAGVIGAN